MSDLFKKFLKEKKKEQDDNIGELEGKKLRYIDSVELFFENVKKWLKCYEDDGLLAIRELNTELHDIGTYQIPKIDIYLGDEDIIQLNPVGALIVGGDGRIDIKYKGFHNIMMVKIKNKWVFVDKSIVINKVEVTEETFKNVISTL